MHLYVSVSQLIVVCLFLSFAINSTYETFKLAHRFTFTSLLEAAVRMTEKLFGYKHSTHFAFNDHEPVRKLHLEPNE